MSVKKPIRVGFDMDGVLLYNPARIARPLISLLKKRKVIQRKELQFFVPKTEFQKMFWRLFHKSSIFISPAINDIEKLVEDGVIEAFIITGRFKHLEKDTNFWTNKLRKKNIFTKIFTNSKDEQPHLFKERKIKELKLDYFVEDNWDIVNYLSSRKIKTKIVWITNLIDKRIDFERKFILLKNFVKTLSSKKKIIFLTDYYLPHWTGLSKSINFIVSAIEDKIRATVLTIDHKNNLKKKEKLDNHQVVRASYLFSFSRAKFSPQLVFKLFKQIRQQDYVVINSPFTFVLPASLIAKLFRKKVFIFHQGDLILPKGLLNKIIEITFNISSFISFWLADGLATYTKDYAINSRLLKYFPDKTSSFVIPFPMSGKTTKKLTKIKKLRNKYDTIVGLSGRFVEEKGFDVLFEAIPSIVKDHKNIHFVFAGEKNMGYEDFFSKHQELFKKVKRNITFLGLLSGDDLEAFYNSIDSLVMPSRSDCFGLVQAEAMKYEKPVIVSNIIGGRDVVTNTSFGEIAELEDADDLAEKIKTFISKKKTYKKYLPEVKKYFNFEKNSKLLEYWLDI